MSNRDKAILVLIVMLAVGAIAQQVAQMEAAALGMTAFELALLGAAAGAVARRKLA